MAKRKAKNQGGGPSRVRRIIDTVIDAGVTYGVNRVLGGGTHHTDNHDQTVDPSHPVEHISDKKTLTKAKKKNYKKKKRFEAKVKDALSTRAPPSLWHEPCNIIAILNTGGANVLRYQEVWDDDAGGSMTMIHPGGLNNTASGAILTYPWKVQDLIQSDANAHSVGTALNRGDGHKRTVRTTSCKVTCDLKTINRVMVTDIYTFVANQTITDVLYSCPRRAWLNLGGVSAQGSARFADANYSSGGSQNTRGRTPLDSPEFGKFWKLESKTRFQMQANTNYQWTMPNVRTVTSNQQEFDDVYAVKGKTQAVMVVCYAPVTTDLFANEALLYVELNKKYQYKMVGSGEGPLDTTNAVATTIVG